MTDCPDGTYGKDCESQCHCQDGMHCHRRSGSCKTPGCYAGWRGHACNKSTYQQHNLCTINMGIVIQHAYYCMAKRRDLLCHYLPLKMRLTVFLLQIEANIE